MWMWVSETTYSSANSRNSYSVDYNLFRGKYNKYYIIKYLYNKFLIINTMIINTKIINTKGINNMIINTKTKKFKI